MMPRSFPSLSTTGRRSGSSFRMRSASDLIPTIPSVLTTTGSALTRFSIMRRAISLNGASG